MSVNLGKRDNLSRTIRLLECIIIKKKQLFEKKKQIEISERILVLV